MPYLIIISIILCIETAFTKCQKIYNRNFRGGRRGGRRPHSQDSRGGDQGPVEQMGQDGPRGPPRPRYRRRGPPRPRGGNSQSESTNGKPVSIAMFN